MNKDELVKNYLEKSEENFKLYKFLSTQTAENSFIEWQAVSIFYSSLCYVKAYLFSLPIIKEESLNSHKQIMNWLTTESNAKRLMIFDYYYNFLYMCARDARYKCGKISKKVVERMLLKHEKIKTILKVNLKQSIEN